MKKFIIILLVLAAVAAGLIFAYREMRKEVAMEMQGEAPVVPESRTRRGASGEVIVSLDAETQKRVALATALVTATNVAAELRGYARVVDPAPLVTAMAEIAAAEAAFTASSNEMSRAKTLFSQGQNVSARTLEQAEATSRRDQIQLEGLRMKLGVTVGKAIAGRSNLTELIRSLADFNSVLVRVELPFDADLKSVPKTIRLVDTARAVEAQVLGAAPTVDSQTQAKALLALAQNDARHLTPGQSLTALIPLSDIPQAGAFLPSSAVLRAEGRLWIYIQSGETNFVRRSVVTDRPLNGGWFVTNGVTAGERIVVEGAQTLLSEEFKSSIPVLAD